MEAGVGVEALRTKGPGDPSWVQLVKRLKGKAAWLSFPSAIILRLGGLEQFA